MNRYERIKHDAKNHIPNRDVGANLWSHTRAYWEFGYSVGFAEGPAWPTSWTWPG